MAVYEEGGILHLTRLGEAVVRRIQSNREFSLASTASPRIPAARQSQIIRQCFSVCCTLIANAVGQQGRPVSRGMASRLILDTLLLFQDERPPPRPHVCLGPMGECRRQITRIQNLGDIPVQTVDVTVRLRQPGGYSSVVSAISMFPVIRRYDHPRLCAEHEGVMEMALNNVLLTQAFLEGVNAAHDRLPTPQNQTRRFRRFPFTALRQHLGR